jgi:hypothetical protein
MLWRIRLADFASNLGFDYNNLAAPSLDKQLNRGSRSRTH